MRRHLRPSIEKGLCIMAFLVAMMVTGVKGDTDAETLAIMCGLIAIDAVIVRILLKYGHRR